MSLFYIPETAEEIQEMITNIMRDTKFDANTLHLITLVEAYHNKK